MANGGGKFGEFVRSPWALWAAIVFNLVWVEYRSDDRFTGQMARESQETLIELFRAEHQRDVVARANTEANQKIMIEQLRSINGTLLALKGHYSFTGSIGTAPKTGAHSVAPRTPLQQRMQ